MREIKFMAYDAVKKIMVFFDLKDLLNAHDWIVTCCTVDGETIDVCYDQLEEPYQYTGRNDKNGKEIYDGSILKENEYVVLVRWQKETASFSLGKKGWMYDHYFIEAINPNECEVIGHIRLNPELME